jgi:hypothetical protein
MMAWVNTRRFRLGLIVALVAAGCGGLSSDGPGDSDPGTPRHTGSDQLILRVETTGGFVPPEYLARTVPEFTLTGDGRTITVGPQIEIYPGPALPALLESTLTEDGIQAILDAAREAGLFGPDQHYDNGCVTDLPTTTFTLVSSGERHEISAYALGSGELEDPSCVGGAAKAEARAALTQLRDRLGTLREWLPQGSLGEEQTFSFDELRIFTRPVTIESVVGDTGIEPSFEDWPLSTPLGEFGEPTDLPPGTRCGTVSGEDLEDLLPAVRRANELTIWRSGGDTFGLVLRPLLPDESGCPEPA